MSGTNVRTMPVVRALFVSRRLWFVGLPDGTDHYIAGRSAVVALVAKEAPGSALRFIGAPETPIPLSDPRIDKSGGFDACWPWRGALTDKGYGRLMRNYRDLRAHRVAWEEANGPIPVGMTIDHLCRNRACCNPAHLEPVTNRENILRGEGLTAQLARRTHCKRGHALPEPDGRGKRSCLACVPFMPSRIARRPGSDMPRGQAANALPSSRTPNRTRPAGNGRTRTASPPGSFR